LGLLKWLFFSISYLMQNIYVLFWNTGVAVFCALVWFHILYLEFLHKSIDSFSEVINCWSSGQTSHLPPRNTGSTEGGHCGTQQT
jgi:hypothetical protein